MFATQRQSALRESNPPRPAWKAGTFAARPRARKSGRRGSRTPKASSLDCFRDSCHRQLACPSVIQAAVAGIEPAKRRLTAACLYQHRPHRNHESGWPDLNRRSQAPRPWECPGFATPWQSRAGIRTADLVLPSTRVPGYPTHLISKAPSGSRTRTSAMARQQAAATSWVHRIAGRIVKDRNRHRGLGARDSNPRRRITGAESSPTGHQVLNAFLKWDQRGSNPHRPG